MTAKETAAALAAVALASALAVGAALTKDEPTPKDVKVLEDELAKGTIPPATVFAEVEADGGVAWVSRYELRDGGVEAIRVDKSPCAWKLAKGDVCFRVWLDGGLKDPGLSNTMQDAKWSGAGCVRKACVQYAGEK